MNSALVVVGTGFVGRHTARELLEHDYDVTALARGTGRYPFPDWLPVDHLTADRTDADALAEAAGQVDPDLVVDGAALYPRDVRTATEILADVDAYVSVSSGDVYSAHTIPKREDERPRYSYSIRSLASRRHPQLIGSWRGSMYSPIAGPGKHSTFRSPFQ